MLNTFTVDQKVINPIFLQLFGDIFQEESAFDSQLNTLYGNTIPPSVVFK